MSICFIFYLSYLFHIQVILLSSCCEYISCHILGMLLVVILMTNICDIPGKLIYNNDPINRKTLCRLGYCWTNLLKYVSKSSKFYVVFTHTSVLWRMKLKEKDTILESVNILLKRLYTEVFLTSESVSYFVLYNFHKVALWNSK